MLADSDMVVWVSAASAWEIATKVRIGKMSGAEHLVVDFGEYLRRWYASALENEAADALHAGVLEWGHRDPFDRMLAAQALQEIAQRSDQSAERRRENAARASAMAWTSAVSSSDARRSAIQVRASVDAGMPARSAAASRALISDSANRRE